MQKLLISCFLVVIFLGLSMSRNLPWANDSDTEGVAIEIDTLYDQQGLLDGFSTRISTPVCEAGKCYAIQINFHWDLIGRYQGYDTIAGEELTKLDHIPFTQDDYQKLENILSNDDSPLRHYQKDELVKKNSRVSEIDGFTGATIKEVKDNVIEGAVYSCYILWHLAYGEITDSLQAVVSSEFDTDLVQKMVSMNDQQVNYFLINHFSSEDFSIYLPMILQVVNSGSGYLPKNTIEKMPADVFGDELAQNFFADKFPELNYFGQLALLKKLKWTKLNNRLKNTLTKNLTQRDSYRNELLLEILDFNN